MVNWYHDIYIVSVLCRSPCMFSKYVILEDSEYFESASQSYDLYLHIFVYS
jgi:hypothetical protein